MAACGLEARTPKGEKEKRDGLHSIVICPRTWRPVRSFRWRVRDSSLFNMGLDGLESLKQVGRSQNPADPVVLDHRQTVDATAQHLGSGFGQ